MALIIPFMYYNYSFIPLTVSIKSHIFPFYPRMRLDKSEWSLFFRLKRYTKHCRTSTAHRHLTCLSSRNVICRVPSLIPSTGVELTNSTTKAKGLFFNAKRHENIKWLLDSLIKRLFPSQGRSFKAWCQITNSPFVFAYISYRSSGEKRLKYQ